eukprot:g2237.t1
MRGSLRAEASKKKSVATAVNDRALALQLVSRLEGGDDTPGLTAKLVALANSSGVVRVALSPSLGSICARAMVAPLRAHDERSLHALRLVCALAEGVPELVAELSSMCTGKKLLHGLTWEPTLAAKILQRRFRQRMNAPAIGWKELAKDDDDAMEFYRKLHERTKAANARMQQELRLEWRECVRLGQGRAKNHEAEVLYLRLLSLWVVQSPGNGGGAGENAFLAVADGLSGAYAPRQSRRMKSQAVPTLPRKSADHAGSDRRASSVRGKAQRDLRGGDFESADASRELLAHRVRQEIAEDERTVPILMMILDEAPVGSTVLLYALHIVSVLAHRCALHHAMLERGVVQRMVRIMDIGAAAARGDHLQLQDAVEASPSAIEDEGTRRTLSNELAMNVLTKLCFGRPYARPNPLSDAENALAADSEGSLSKAGDGQSFDEAREAAVVVRARQDRAKRLARAKRVLGLMDRHHASTLRKKVHVHLFGGLRAVRAVAKLSERQLRIRMENIRRMFIDAGFDPKRADAATGEICGEIADSSTWETNAHKRITDRRRRAYVRVMADVAAVAEPRAEADESEEEFGGDGGGQGGGGRFVCTLATLGTSCVSRLLELLLFGSGGMERMRALRVEAQRVKKAKERAARAAAEEKAAQAKQSLKTAMISSNAFAKGLLGAVDAPTPTPAPPSQESSAEDFDARQSIVFAKVMGGSFRNRKEVAEDGSVSRAQIMGGDSTKTAKDGSVSRAQIMGGDSTKTADDGSVTRALRQRRDSQVAIEALEDLCPDGEVGVGALPAAVAEEAKESGPPERDIKAEVRLRAAAQMEAEAQEARRWSHEQRQRDWWLRTAAARVLAKLADDRAAAVAIAEPQPEAIPLLVQLLREAQHSGPASSLAVSVAKILLCLARYRMESARGEDEAVGGTVPEMSRYWYYHGALLKAGALQATAIVLRRRRKGVGGLFSQLTLVVHQLFRELLEGMRERGETGMVLAASRGGVEATQGQEASELRRADGDEGALADDDAEHEFKKARSARPRPVRPPRAQRSLQEPVLPPPHSHTMHSDVGERFVAPVVPVQQPRPASRAQK